MWIMKCMVSIIFMWATARRKLLDFLYDKSMCRQEIGHKVSLLYTYLSKVFICTVMIDIKQKLIY